MNKLFLSLLGIALFFSLMASPANAAPVNQILGAQSERFNHQVEQDRKRLEEKSVTRPKVKSKTQQEPVAASPSFILKEIHITGMTVFNPDDFKVFYQSLIGTTVSLKEIQIIADQIKAKYKRKGFLTTLVTIPQQDVMAGQVEIKVLEGQMGELKIEGNRRFSTRLIASYFHLKKGQILNILELERDLMRLNKISDMSAKSFLAAGSTPQTTDVTLKVEDRLPFHAGYNVDNQGTRLVGRLQQTLTLRSSNLTGAADSMYGSYMFGKHENAQSVTYIRPLNTYGTKVGMSFSNFHLRLWKQFKTSDITGSTKIWTPFINQELFLSESMDIQLNAGLDIKSIKQYTMGHKTNEDQLRVPYIGVDYTENDSTGQTVVSPRFDGGVNTWGASHYDNPQASRAGSDGAFQKYTINITRTQRMFFDSYSTLHAEGQFSADKLNSSEQLQLGGFNSVRGYPEGDYEADRGVVVNVDWIFPMYFIPGSWKLPGAQVPLKHQIEPVFFVDWGNGSLNSPISGEPNAEIMTGIGGGLRISVIKGVFARLEWAQAIGRNKPASGNGPSTFYFSIQSEI